MLSTTEKIKVLLQRQKNDGRRACGKEQGRTKTEPVK